MINIRRAQYSDSQGIIDSHVRSIREVCSKDYTPEQIEAWAGKNFKTELWCRTIDRDHVWVIELDSQVKGFGHLAILDDSTGEIMGLYLSPEIQKIGAGGRLFTVIINAAKTHGISKLQLYATITAKTFYEKYGFVQTAGECSVEMRGVPIPCFPMEWKM